jgi:hypothetical protein
MLRYDSKPTMCTERRERFKVEYLGKVESFQTILENIQAVEVRLSDELS